MANTIYRDDTDGTRQDVSHSPPTKPDRERNRQVVPLQEARVPAMACNDVMDEELRQELLARQDEDQRVRHLVRGEPGRLSDDMAAQWQRVDEENTRWLADLVAIRGWPGRSLVGEDGALAAWLLAQHADRDREHQRAFLDSLRDAVSQGEASPAHLAYLEDRVRVGQGQQQLYGTQFTFLGDELAPHPIEDPERLDERRAAVGLQPFAEYEALIRDQ